MFKVGDLVETIPYDGNGCPDGIGIVVELNIGYGAIGVTQYKIYNFNLKKQLWYFSSEIEYLGENQ